MPTYGPVYPGAARQEHNPAAYGASQAQNWSNPLSARFPDGSWAEVWSRGGDGQSHWLVLEDFDWTGVPPDIRVRGILVEILARTRNDSLPYPQIRRVRLRRASGPIGEEREGAWLTSNTGAWWNFVWFRMGGDGDTWGATIVRSDLGPQFGVQLYGFTSGWRTTVSDIGSTLDIEAVRLTLYYDEVDPREHQVYQEQILIYDTHVSEDEAAPRPGDLITDPFEVRPGWFIWWMRYSGDFAYWRAANQVPRVPEVQLPEFSVLVLDALTQDGATLIVGEPDTVPPPPGEPEPPPSVDVDPGQRTVPGTGDRAGGFAWEKTVVENTWQKR